MIRCSVPTLVSGYQGMWLERGLKAKPVTLGYGHNLHVISNSEESRHESSRKVPDLIMLYRKN